MGARAALTVIELLCSEETAALSQENGARENGAGSRWGGVGSARRRTDTGAADAAVVASGRPRNVAGHAQPRPNLDAVHLEQVRRRSWDHPRRRGVDNVASR